MDITKKALLLGCIALIIGCSEDSNKSSSSENPPSEDPDSEIQTPPRFLRLGVSGEAVPDQVADITQIGKVIYAKDNIEIKCIRDSKTGLTWSFTQMGDSLSSEGLDLAAAEDLVITFNAENTCGAANWRLPSISELESNLISTLHPVCRRQFNCNISQTGHPDYDPTHPDFERIDSTLQPTKRGVDLLVYFLHFAPVGYWSSEEGPTSANVATFYGHYYKGVELIDKSLSASVRLVHD